MPTGTDQTGLETSSAPGLLRRPTADFIAASMATKPDFDTERLAEMSGYQENKNAFSYAHANDPDDDENVEDRKRRRQMRMANVAMRADIFSHAGHDLNFNEMMDSIRSVTDELENNIDQLREEAVVDDANLMRLPNGQLVMNDKQLENYLNQHGNLDGITGFVMITDTTVVNGVRMDNMTLTEIKDEQETLALTQQYEGQAAHIELQLESGVITPEQANTELVQLTNEMPADVKDEIVSAHTAAEQSAPTEQTIFQTPMTEVAASMQEVAKVVAVFAPPPAATPDPSP